RCRGQGSRGRGDRGPWTEVHVYRWCVATPHPGLWRFWGPGAVAHLEASRRARGLFGRLCVITVQTPKYSPSVLLSRTPSSSPAQKTANRSPCPKRAKVPVWGSHTG